ncbi:helix-turn-helix domain-containing protein [Mesonia sp.]|uniref:helix-turn-helix domain-containing protein n=1 Tax=Mesonia sp. TaxID=1960830 RepID=UPI003F9EAEE2
MKEVDLTTIIGIISTFIALLLAIFIFSVGSKNKISNKLFSIFLVLNALEFSGWFTHLFFNAPNNFLAAKTLLAYLSMPIFYLYILSVCYSNFKLKWNHLWHIAPLIVANLIFIPRIYLSDTSQKLRLFESYNSLYEIIFLHVSLHLQAIIYIIAGFIVLNKAKKIFVENYSSNTIESYKWLFQLLLFSAILYTVAIVKNILKYSGQQNMFKNAQITVGVVVLCVVCWYVLKALRYPSLFNGVNSKTKLVTSLGHQETPINSEEVEQLTSYMETKKPYLNPSLSIRNLAEEIEMNSRDLSILINKNLNQHFFDFVNEYRIKV